MLGTFTLIGLVVLAFLVFLFMRTRRQDQISALMEKRRGSATLVSKADYANGIERMPVSLALTSDSVYYENPDLEASLELARIDEVEYDDELTTGKSVEQTSRVLRIRSHGTPFEFVMPAADATRWQQALPPRQAGQPAARVG
ncbi:MAG TPA: hypothetical protein VFT12_05540 [Thermoanaerobaculia bacterium]|nr:hypothetical protein [Thermoanaerobaculia bacterium]